MGCIYKRGSIYWIKYYRNGKPYCESSHSEKEADAKKRLKLREGEISKGELPGICFDKVRFDELAEDYLTDYRINDKKSLRDAERYIRNLKESFSGRRVTEITTAGVRKHIDKKLENGLSNASINRDLSALKRIFHLAYQCTPPKVAQIPYIPMMKESNVRQGFFEHGEFTALRDALPSYLKSVVTFAYHIGWRLGEIKGLTWDKVDLKEEIIRLDPGETKNNEGRTIYLNDELKELMRALHSNRRLGCPYVFNREGIQINNIARAWKKACLQAGL